MTQDTVETTALTDAQQKAMVVDALVGLGVPAKMPVLQLNQAGYVYWTGDKYGEQWRWDKSKLAEHTAEDLLALYMEAKYAGE